MKYTKNVNYALKANRYHMYKQLTNFVNYLLSDFCLLAVGHLVLNVTFHRRTVYRFTMDEDVSYKCSYSNTVLIQQY